MIVRNHSDSVTLQKYHSLSNQSFKHNLAHMSSLDLTSIFLLNLGFVCSLLTFTTQKVNACTPWIPCLLYFQRKYLKVLLSLVSVFKISPFSTKLICPLSHDLFESGGFVTFHKSLSSHGHFFSRLSLHNNWFYFFLKEIRSSFFASYISKFRSFHNSEAATLFKSHLGMDVLL